MFDVYSVLDEFVGVCLGEVVYIFGCEVLGLFWLCVVMFIGLCFFGCYDKDWFICCVCFVEMGKLGIGEDFVCIGDFIGCSNDKVLWNC